LRRSPVEDALDVSTLFFLSQDPFPRPGGAPVLSFFFVESSLCRRRLPPTTENAIPPPSDFFFLSLSRAQKGQSPKIPRGTFSRTSSFLEVRAITLPRSMLVMVDPPRLLPNRFGQVFRRRVFNPFVATVVTTAATPGCFRSPCARSSAGGESTLVDISPYENAMFPVFWMLPSSLHLFPNRLSRTRGTPFFPFFASGGV